METNNRSFFERLNGWLKTSITIKLISMGVIILLLMIPSSMIQDIIRERESTNTEAIDEVSSKWGGSQTISGPIISVPYKIVYRQENGYTSEATEYYHFLPEYLKITGEVVPEKRYRGIHEVVVYKSNLLITGKLIKPKITDSDIDPSKIMWKDAFIQMGLSDMRGINENIKMDLDKKEFSFNPGIPTNDIVASGVSAPLNNIDSLNTEMNFDIKISLNGSSNLFFSPLGKETIVNIKSSWSDPSFDGAFLPDNRKIDAAGFTADWKVIHLNRNYPQQWRSSKFNINGSNFGVNFMVPVDHYTKTTRSAKYSFLVIFLTFLGFFFVEVFIKKRIHPFQYILIGLAICLFYTLVLSLSEHIGFNMAYIVSTILTIGAISLYASGIFKNTKTTILLSSVLVTLYGFIYIIIQLQDYSLLVGNIGLFIILVAIMYFSRKINWYPDNSENNN